MEDNSLLENLDDNQNTKPVTLPKKNETVIKETVVKSKKIEKKIDRPVGEIRNNGEDIMDFAKKIQKKAEEESKIKTIQKVNYLKVGRGLAYNCKEKFGLV